MPSTFVAFKIISAEISLARNAAVVSVEKYGFPVPATKITILPRSRCLVARLWMYGYASLSIGIAL